MQVEDVGEADKEARHEPRAASLDHKSLLAGREIKDKLTEIFSPNKFKSRTSLDSQLPESPIKKKKDRGPSACLEWAAGYMPRGRAEISETCRRAFVATCHLLLECTTFPVYLTEDETLALHTDMFSDEG